MAIFSCAYAQPNFTPGEIAPLFKKPFNQVADYIAENGYSYTTKQKLGNSLVFSYSKSTMRGDFTIQLMLSNNKITSIIVDEWTPYYPHIMRNFERFDYSLTQSKNFSEMTPSVPSMGKFVNKANKMAATVICGFDVQDKHMFSINYSPL